MEDDNVILPASRNRARKRKRDPSAWKKNMTKRLRYSCKAFPKMPSCKHQASVFKCNELGMQDIRRMSEAFYSTPDRQAQSEFILKFVSIESTERKRSRKNSFEKQFTARYYLNIRRNKVVKKVQVCKKTFIETLGVSKDRVQLLCKQFFESGRSPEEKRGGDTRSEKFTEKRNAVKTFIESLSCVEKHYCRGKNFHRQYLSSDLSISKLHKMYLDKVNSNLKVNYEYFRTVFVTDYNISFGSPSTDVCSFCLSHTEAIAAATDPIIKQKLQTELTIHKMKAKCFYNILKSKQSAEKVLSFDCEKNLVLPKLPDQSAYYLRQMYVYNFTVCEGLSTEKQNKTNTFCYTWLENEYQKGSSQIASAIYHRLCETDLTDINTIRLVADGCGGQNKNMTMVGMVCTWLQQKAPSTVKSVVFTFPIIGHSFIPPDRIFGRIEKIVSRKTNIIKPEEYLQIFKEVGTVLQLGSDVEVLDWKKAVESTAKKTSSWNFQFMASKRIFVKKTKNGGIVVRGEPSYNVDVGTGKGICKRGKSRRDKTPAVINKGVPLKPAKRIDLGVLLQKHYGDNWKTNSDLHFYEKLLQNEGDALDAEDQQELDDCGDIPDVENVVML